MDPNTRGPEEYGHDDGPSGRRPPRDPLTSDFGQHAPAPARTARLVSGDLLLTVNPVDGSEIEVCPPAERPARPAKRTPAERAEAARAARPPVPPGPARPAPPLLGRQEERERLIRLLARGRSARVTGPAGSGRTTLLDTVAEDCADLAPDGVVRLCGLRRTADDLLHDLFHAVYAAPGHRPDREQLLELVGEIGAVVVLDDAELGGAALDELLDATPECAFLIGAAPGAPAPSADAGIEEVALGGLDRAGGLRLLEHAVGRPLTEDEANWAGDLWFESEGLPLRFVQAGALLRQRDRLRAGADALDEFGVFGDIPADPAFETPVDPAALADDVPLPSLAEGAAPAALLASRLSPSARATLRFAVALGGEVPHQAHLPALVGDTHADAALGELLRCALVSPVGTRYRLAAGVRTQLEAAGYAQDAPAHALTAARHYAWWAGHPSVDPERVGAEADALLAALQPAAPVGDDGDSPAVRLARTAAPAFAAGLHWSAWERALRAGAEAARLAGDVAGQAYFQHELGVLALCRGRLDRARAELEASIGLRGALADKRGTVAGRRALALVADRSGTPGLATAPGGGTAAIAGAGLPFGDDLADFPDAFADGDAAKAPASPEPFPELQPPTDAPALAAYGGVSVPGTPSRHTRAGLRGLARRNLVAAGAGALLVAVLGTVVTLGATSDNDAEGPSGRVGVNPTATQDDGEENLGVADGDDVGDTGSATSRPTAPGPDGTLGTADDPTPTAVGDNGDEGADEPDAEPTGTTKPDDEADPSTPTRPSTSKPTSSSPTPSPSSDESQSPSPDPTPSQSSPTPTDTSTSPSTTNSATGPGTSTASSPEDPEDHAEEPVI
ncbi:ATP-binding protein [Streptomyces sp. NPDC006610]|uniref:ATP-binding protein n=1 Tax=Streptomyces sp. NPDC006610 TaxID=3154584 RepID=UPI0033A70593